MTTQTSAYVLSPSHLQPGDVIHNAVAFSALYTLVAYVKTFPHPEAPTVYLDQFTVEPAPSGARCVWNCIACS